MKDMGKAYFVLRFEILRDYSKRLLSLSQKSYIKKILERFRLQNYKPINTIIEKWYTLSLNECLKNDEEMKQMGKVHSVSVIGNLMYAMLCTQPDICLAVRLVSCYQSNSSLVHW